MKEKRK